MNSRFFLRLCMIVNGTLIEYRCDSRRSRVQQKKNSNINSNNSMSVESINVNDIRKRKMIKRY